MRLYGKAWRYQMGTKNKNRQCNRQTKKVKKDPKNGLQKVKQKKCYDWATQTPQILGGGSKIKCTGRNSSSSPTSGIRLPSLIGPLSYTFKSPKTKIKYVWTNWTSRGTYFKFSSTSYSQLRKAVNNFKRKDETKNLWNGPNTICLQRFWWPLFKDDKTTGIPRLFWGVTLFCKSVS